MEPRLIWLINVGEPLPIEGNKPHRMSSWKSLLEQDGYQVKYITTNFEHQRKKWKTVNLDGYIALKSFISYKKNISVRRLLNHFCLSISLLLLLLKTNKKPDLIIVSYPTMLLSLVATIYGKIKRIKVFVDVRDKWPDIFATNLIIKQLLIFHRLIKFLIFKYASFILAVSPQYLIWATNKKSNIDFIPLSKPSIKPLIRNLDSSEEINFIFSGTLGDTYNLNLISEFSTVLTLNKIKHKINVCGDGPKLDYLRSLTKNNSNIVLLGWLNNKELQDQLDNAHFGLMFYNNNSPQGWPNKLIEYMSNGLPIINSLNGESALLIQSYELGINIDETSITNSINFIVNLLESPDNYEKISNNNYSLFSRDFTEDKAYQKLKKIISNYV